jgi:MFS family permease
MPSLLAPERLQAGNALNSAAVRLGSLLGPVLGGVLVASAGSTPAFAADAASFAVSALTLGLLVSRARAVPAATAADVAAADAPADQGRAGPEPREPSGIWPLLRHSRLLQVIIAVTVVANLTSGGTFEITLLQQWAPVALLGRVMSVVMLASMGSFPVSVALAGILVRAFGPVPFFPVDGAVLAVVVLGALSQRELRDFGVAPSPAAEPETLPGLPGPAKSAGPAEPATEPAKP